VQYPKKPSPSSTPPRTYEEPDTSVNGLIGAYLKEPTAVPLESTLALLNSNPLLENRATGCADAKPLLSYHPRSVTVYGVETVNFQPTLYPAKLSIEPPSKLDRAGIIPPRVAVGVIVGVCVGVVVGVGVV
jgi:hypothetical protein